MPQVTVYIRKDDLFKWEALKKKSEFIHNALNHKLNLVATELNKPIKTPKDAEEVMHSSFSGGDNEGPSITISPTASVPIPKSFSARKKH